MVGKRDAELLPGIARFVGRLIGIDGLGAGIERRRDRMPYDRNDFDDG
jgi:hypothetical protein